MLGVIFLVIVIVIILFGRNTDKQISAPKATSLGLFGIIAVIIVAIFLLALAAFAFGLLGPSAGMT